MALFSKDVYGLVSNPKYGHGASSKKIFLPSKHIQYRIPEKTRRGYGLEYDVEYGDTPWNTMIDTVYRYDTRRFISALAFENIDKFSWRLFSEREERRGFSLAF